MDTPSFVLVRQRADAVLPRLRQIPGLDPIHIERHRGREIPAGDAPVLLYYLTDVSSQLISGPGAAPRFRETVKLAFRAWTRALRMEDAEAQMETLLGGVRTLLLSAQSFLAPPLHRIASMDLALNVDAKEAKTLFSAVLTVDIEMEEQFQPLLIDPLNVVQTTVQLGPNGAPSPVFTEKLPV